MATFELFVLGGCATDIRTDSTGTSGVGDHAALLLRRAAHRLALR